MCFDKFCTTNVPNRLVWNHAVVILQYRADKTHAKSRKSPTLVLDYYFSAQVWSKKSCALPQTILGLRKIARNSALGAHMTALGRGQGSDFAENQRFERFSLFSSDIEELRRLVRIRMSSKC